MYKGKVIAVVIPAYNEEGFVGDVMETVPSFVDHIYPVDDCSTDGTWAEIMRVTERMNGISFDRQPVRAVTDGGQTPSDDGQTADDDQSSPLTDGGRGPIVIPLRHAYNRGVGGTIKTGYRRAMNDDVDVVAVMNGDGQMDPDILDRILDPVVEGDADYAKGNRLLSSDHWNGMSRFRLFGNLVLTYLTRISSGYWQMTDPQNGYTAISVPALQQLDVDSLYGGYGFLNDLLVKLNANDMRIADVEMSAVYGDENSSIQYHQFIPRLSWLLLWDFFWRLTVKYGSGNRRIAVPYLAGVLGGLLIVGSLLASITPVVNRATLGRTLGVLVVCLLFVGIGMLLDRRRHEPLEITVRK